MDEPDWEAVAAAARSRKLLAEIKDREQAVRDAIDAANDRIDIGQFTMGQLGLSPVVVDKFGRLWCHEPGRLTLIYAQYPFSRG